MARAAAVVKEMLHDRGLELGELATIGDSEIRRLAETLDFFHLRAGDRDVVFVTRKLKTQDLQKAASALDEARRDRAILVVTEKPASFHRATVEAYYGKEAEIFSLRELQFNVSRHALVPPHKKLSDAEVREVLRTYMLTDKKALPSILSSDPMAKYTGARPGDVLRIERPSPTAGRTVFYRPTVASRPC